MGKLGKITGVAGDLITTGVEVYDNNYNADTGEWEFTTESVVGTVSDVAIDIGTSAGAAATGAAVGSFFAPPIGTVVGAVAGIVIDIGINWKFDLDGDGESNSAVGLLKDGVDFVTQKIMDLI